MLPSCYAVNLFEAYPLNVTVDAGSVSVVRIVSVREIVIGSGTSVTIKVVESIIVLLLFSQQLTSMRRNDPKCFGEAISES